MKLLFLSLLLSISVKAEDSLIKVMVIDTGVTPTKYTKRFINDQILGDDYKDSHGHGTHIAGIIINGNLAKDSVTVCDSVKLYSCKYYYPGEKYELTETIRCIEKAIKMGVNYINYSSTGPDPDPTERAVIQKASDLGIKIVASAGNDNLDRLEYPAGYDIENLIPVGNMTYEGNIQQNSNYTGGIVYDYGTNIISNAPNETMVAMTGTSQAAAMYTHRLLLKKCNQIKENNKNALHKNKANDILNKDGGFYGKSNNSDSGIRFDWTGRIVSESYL